MFQGTYTGTHIMRGHMPDAALRTKGNIRRILSSPSPSAFPVLHMTVEESCGGGCWGEHKTHFFPTPTPQLSSLNQFKTINKERGGLPKSSCHPD